MAFSIASSRMALCLAIIVGLCGAVALYEAVQANMGRGAAIAAALTYAGLCRWRWLAEQRRRPVAIRIMGGDIVRLYFRPADRSALLSNTAPGAASETSYDRYPSLRLRISRLVLWPDCLIALKLDVVAEPAGLPACGVAHRPAVVPRAVVIFRDMMPSAAFRMLHVHLNCAQRNLSLPGA